MKQLFLKRNAVLFLTLALTTLLSFGCSENNDVQADSTDAKEKIIIGVTAGPHETIMNYVKEAAAEQGLEIKIVSFHDYIQPNTQLAEGGLDMNAMQHLPFLENTIDKKGYALSNMGNNILIPMCILSEKINHLEELADHAVVGIPNDTTNQARALILLQSAGLITLSDPASATATPKDIISNPYNLQFQQLEAGLLLPALPDFDFAVINSNYAVDAGRVPGEEALYVESTENNPWVNIFVCRAGEEDTPAYQKLMEIYQTEEVKQFINETYQGAVLAAW